jgi:hypothetical protein
MSMALEVIKGVIPKMEDESLRELASLLNETMVARGLRGRPTGKPTRGEITDEELDRMLEDIAKPADKPPAKATMRSWKRKVTSVDWQAMKEGRGFYALPGPFVRSHEANEGVVIHKSVDGYQLSLNGTVLTDRAHGKFGPTYEAMNSHPQANLIYTAALLVLNDSHERHKLES